MNKSYKKKLSAILPGIKINEAVPMYDRIVLVIDCSSKELLIGLKFTLIDLWRYFDLISEPFLKH